ncbi:MAG: GNAT superfamily N-acetyltransferase [Paraglaciecola sp.]|jgi:GNAT superfamily N-acetyltransferase
MMKCWGAGFVIASKLAWGKHLYVDDLVTAPLRRFTGVGSQMLKWLTDYGAKQQCIQLHLDSGVQPFAAHRFYLRAGFHISSHHFALDLPDALS